MASREFSRELARKPGPQHRFMEEPEEDMDEDIRRLMIRERWRSIGPFSLAHNPCLFIFDEQASKNPKSNEGQPPNSRDSPSEEEESNVMVEVP